MLQLNDRPIHLAFATKILICNDVDNNYYKQVVFSDEAIFHKCVKVNEYNVRIWGSEHPHVIIEHERDNPKGNVLCGHNMSI